MKVSKKTAVAVRNVHNRIGPNTVSPRPFQPFTCAAGGGQRRLHTAQHSRGEWCHCNANNVKINKTVSMTRTPDISIHHASHVLHGVPKTVTFSVSSTGLPFLNTQLI